MGSFSFPNLSVELNPIETSELIQLKDLGKGNSPFQIFLIFNTQQVLSRSGKITKGSKEEQIHNLFPNINLEQFYYELTSDGDQTQGAICRRQLIDETLQSFYENHLIITGWSLKRLNLINLPNSFQSVVNNTEMNSDNELLIHGITIQKKYIPAFSGAFVLASKFRKSTTNFYLEEKKQKGKFLQHRLFKYGLPTATTILLLALLVNFLAFNSNYAEVTHIKGQSQINDLQKETVLKLQKRVNEKQKMLEEAINSSTSQSSFYVDQIATSLPKSMLLNELNYQPLINAINDDKAISYSENIILIKGTTQNSAAISNWISTLEKRAFIKDVEIASLQQDEENESQFEIRVSLESGR